MWKKDLNLCLHLHGFVTKKPIVNLRTIKSKINKNVIEIYAVLCISHAKLHTFRFQQGVMTCIWRVQLWSKANKFRLWRTLLTRTKLLYGCAQHFEEVGLISKSDSLYSSSSFSLWFTSFWFVAFFQQCIVRHFFSTQGILYEIDSKNESCKKKETLQFRKHLMEIPPMPLTSLRFTWPAPPSPSRDSEFACGMESCLNFMVNTFLVIYFFS